MKLKFVTLFPQACDIHLNKDVGQIPYQLYRMFDYDADLLCFANETHYPNLIHTKGLGLPFFRHKNKRHPIWASIQYLLSNARKIDILNLYGQSRFSFLVGLFYKLLHPKGILYLKLDMNIEYLKGVQESKNLKRHLFFWNFYFQKIASILSVEYQQLIPPLCQLYQFDATKLIHIPNGIDDARIAQFPFKRIPFVQKENIILTVGRIGAAEKNNEMLLDMAAKLDLRDWKIIFIGPVEADFEFKVQELYRRIPDLKRSLLLLGAIHDFEKLSSWYNRSKIFCLSSSREGFPMVLSEALYWGNYIVAKNISSIAEIIDNGTLGSLFDTEDELLMVLQGLIVDENLMAQKTQASIEKAEQNYLWSKIVPILDAKIKEFITV